MYTATAEQDIQMIEALLKLINKTGISAGTLGYANSYRDTLPAEDVIEALNYLADGFDRDEALVNISILMRKYQITLEDIKTHLSKL